MLERVIGELNGLGLATEPVPEQRTPLATVTHASNKETSKDGRSSLGAERKEGGGKGRDEKKGVVAGDKASTRGQEEGKRDKKKDERSGAMTPVKSSLPDEIGGAKKDGHRIIEAQQGNGKGRGDETRQQQQGGRGGRGKGKGK